MPGSSVNYVCCGMVSGYYFSSVSINMTFYRFAFYWSLSINSMEHNISVLDSFCNLGRVDNAFVWFLTARPCKESCSIKHNPLSFEHFEYSCIKIIDVLVLIIEEFRCLKSSDIEVEPFCLWSLLHMSFRDPSVEVRRNCYIKSLCFEQLWGYAIRIVQLYHILERWCSLFFLQLFYYGCGPSYA